MVLICTEDQRLLPLIDFLHEFSNPAEFALLNDDLRVEVAFGEIIPNLDFSLQDFIFGVPDIGIDGARHLAHFEGREEAVFNPVP